MNCWNKRHFGHKSNATSVSNSKHLGRRICLNRNCTNIWLLTVCSPGLSLNWKCQYILRWCKAGAEECRRTTLCRSFRAMTRKAQLFPRLFSSPEVSVLTLILNLPGLQASVNSSLWRICAFSFTLTNCCCYLKYVFARSAWINELINKMLHVECSPCLRQGQKQGILMTKCVAP